MVTCKMATAGTVGSADTVMSMAVGDFAHPPAADATRTAKTATRAKTRAKFGARRSRSDVGFQDEDLGVTTRGNLPDGRVIHAAEIP
jgi:hypothetical protein